MTCFNKRDFIPEFLRLSSELLRLGFEIVLVDDGSNDGSTDLLKAHVQNYPQIKFVPLIKNNGSANARNQGLKACTRNYIFFLDIDDSCNPTTLKRSVLELATTDCDFLVANFEILQETQLDWMPIKVSIPTQVEMKEIASQILQTMGYWRYIYSRNFIINSSLRFFPTRPESSFRNFILDDAFWLLLISASKSKALICEKERVVYYYNRPVDTPQAWNFYLTQLQLIPNLLLIFLNTFLPNSYLNSTSLVKNSIRWLIQVLRPLNFGAVFYSELLTPKVFKSLSDILKSVQVNRVVLAKLYIHAIFFGIKNSIRIRKRVRILN